ncbi:CHAP and LysM peptidoglycan-binding domain-containing protein [Macrococcus bovicus]|uniref:CHAP and LysM peptidoglycan-binding domain-containing protein n=1 Tax=Macrococcus bovicus TaxID=69968 RepID=UPI0025A61D18|nr:LysM peptidoglycan-binding domain-containing protein [Macrococcus bovicus]WJP97053.1 LysM peptidoglycan-binding domain-containing protein [Macrococcus bovicus]
MFKVTQYNTKKDCFRENCLLDYGSKYDHVLESHMDAFSNPSAEDAHICVAAGYDADAADLAIVAVLKKWFGVRYENGISWRDNLQNMTTALTQGCSYRLVEFGFITNNEELNIFTHKMDEIALDIAKAMQKVGGSWLLIAGHGGEGQSYQYDPGAMNGNHKEAELVRQLNQKIYNHCQNLINGKAPAIKKKPASTPAAAVTAKKDLKPAVKVPNSYRSKKGETLESIAKKFRLTQTQIKSYNTTIPAQLEAGTFMYLKDQTKEKTKKPAVEKVKPAMKKPAAVKTVVHTVKKGETLWQLANQYKRTVSEIVHLNGLTTDKIFVGQKLKMTGVAVPQVKAIAVTPAVDVEDVFKYVMDLVRRQTYVDMDNAYYGQCMDLTIAVAFKFFKWWPSGNAIKLSTQTIPPGWQRIKNTPDFVPKRGDILIWNNSEYGHTAIATGKGDTTWFESVDQNWYGNGDGRVPAQVIRHDYNKFWGVLRPPYKK